MLKYCLVGIFLTFCVIGCSFLDQEIKTLPDGTQVLTYKGEKYLLAAKDIADITSNSGFPVLSLAGGGLSGLLAIATGVLGKIAANRNNAAKTSILAIESFDKDYEKLKESILMISKLTNNPDVTQKIEETFDKLKTVKQVAFDISKITGIEKILDSLVQKTVKSVVTT